MIGLIIVQFCIESYTTKNNNKQSDSTLKDVVDGKSSNLIYGTYN